MKRLVGIIILVGVFLFGCAEDIVIPQGSELRGAYLGIYQITWNYGSGSNPQTERQNVDWRFTDYKFYLNVPLGDTQQITNDLSGDYEAANKMIFSNILKEPGSFKPESVPEGEFSLIRTQSSEGRDSLVMEQLIENVMKTVIIVRQPAPN